MSLVVHVPGTGGGAAALLVGRTGAYEVDFVGEAGRYEVVPDGGAPAGDFGDRVAHGHWDVRSEMELRAEGLGGLLNLIFC